MVRAVLALLVLAGCDQLFQIEHVSAGDGGPSDGNSDGKANDAGPRGHYVQGVSKTLISGTTLLFALPDAQSAGDLLVIFVGWTTSTSAPAVADSRGDSFQAAGGTTTGNNLCQVMFYAQNINAGMNTISISFSGSTPDVDARVLEYTAMAKANVLEQASSKAETGTTHLTSNPIAVAANSVIVAGFMSNAMVVDPGPGYTERIKTSVGNYAEDRDVAVQDTYLADATQSNTGAYIVHVAAFAAE